MKKIIAIMALLILLPLASAEKLYYEDENVGLVTIDIQESPLEKFFDGISNALSIAVTKKSLEIGDEQTIRVITEVPCEDRNGNPITTADISTAKFVITDPNSRTTNFNIIGRVGACQSNQIKFSMVPLKEGRYFVHYVVMQSKFPQILVKEIDDFTVVKSSPQCEKEEITAWKFLFNINGGKQFNRFKNVYDNNCELIPSQQVQYFKTECNSGFIIEGSSQSFAEGKHKCVEKLQSFPDEQPEPTPQPTPEPTPAPAPVEEEPVQTVKCTQDAKQLCSDGSQITAYSCVNGLHIYTGEQCPTDDEGRQGDIPLLTRLFDLDVYGLYTYVILSIIIVGTGVVLFTRPKKKRAKKNGKKKK